LKLKKQYGLYAVKEHLDSAGRRVCCRAADPFLGRDVTLQLLIPPETCGPEKQQILEQRLDAIASLDHPAFAPIYDIGREEDICYYTRPFYKNGRLIKNSQRLLQPQEALVVIRRLAEGLRYAHDKGFGHGPVLGRDLFVNDLGQAVLVDFGIDQILNSLCPSEEALPPVQLAAESQKRSLQSLGALFLSLVLTEEQASGAFVDQILRMKGNQEKDLISALLGLSKQKIENYETLLSRLDALIEPGKGSAKKTTKQPQKQPARQATNESASSQAKVADPTLASIRKLVEEKMGLEARLKVALEARTYAEDRLLRVEQTFKEYEQNSDPSVGPRMWTEAVSGGWKRAAAGFCAGVLIGLVLMWAVNDGAGPHGENAQAIAAAIAVPPRPAAEIPASREETVATADDAQGESDAPVVSTQVVEEQSVAPVIEESVVEVAEEKQETPLIASQKEDWIPVGSEFGRREGALEFRVDLTIDLPLADKHKVLDLLQGWAWAWQTQSVSAYLDHYSVDFQPAAGITRQQWSVLRESRLQRPEWIKVQLTDLQIRSISSDHVQVRMRQDYSSDYYRDQTIKAVDLRRENQQWRIWREQSVSALMDELKG